MNATAPTTCPQCGQPIAAGLHGLCADCLAAVGFGALVPAESQTRATPQESRPAATVRLTTPTEKPGDTIGRYKLLQKVGEGGCGTVYMAEQSEPVRRKVALKVIKLGMDTKSVIARFDAERQALAMMDHPNIAKVLDAGATDAGRPYFVMELVRGIPITKYCDENSLPTDARLNLFTQVCSAIQHAHQKGIIHRDIKPSNILVTLHDGVPVPKVIDFGIAKATEARLTDLTLFTELHAFVGTPAYMSPEQAEMSGLDMDTRADIYSLGVLLYELLSGKLPFDPETLLKAGLDEMRRTIREVEPPRPSTRLLDLVAADVRRLQSTPPPTSCAEEETRASSRRLLQRQEELAARLRGDLDWIVMKALEKDRTRRYESASAFAQDIKRYLGNEAVLACPPSAAYLLQKLVRRHRLAFAAGAAVMATLLAGIAMTTWQAVRATQAEREQVTLRTQADIERGKAVVQRDRANSERERAEALAEQNRQNLYVSRINLVQQVLEQGEVDRARKLLDSLRPSPNQTDLRGFEWYYLWRLCHPEHHQLDTHTGAVRSVAYSPDGSLLATAGHRNEIRLWDAKTGQLQRALSGHRGWISAVAFSPDGRTLASASADRTVRLWDLAGNPLHTWEGFTNEVICLAFSPQGNRLAAATGKMASGAGNPLTRFSQSGAGGEVRIWNSDTSTSIVAFQANRQGILSLAFSQDGTVLATGSPEGKVQLWNASTGQLQKDLIKFPGPVFALGFSRDGKRFAAAGWWPYRSMAELRFWNPQSWQELPAYLSRAPAVMALAFSPDGRTVATGGNDQVVRLWDTTNGQEKASFKGHSEGILSLAFSPDGRQIASGGWDKTARIWNATQRQEREVLVNTVQGYSISYSADGKVMAGAGTGRIGICEVADPTRYCELPLKGVEDVSVVLSPDGKSLAAAGTDGVLNLFDVATRSLRHSLHGHKGKIWSLAVSPDGKTVASGGSDTTVKLWDTATGELRATLAGHYSTVTVLAFTPDGGRLFSGSSYELITWDVAARQKSSVLKEPAPVLAISANGKMLAYGSKTTGINLRRMEDNQPLAVVHGHKNSIYRIALSADGKTLATASWDGTAKLWRTTGGELLLTIPSELGVTWSAAFSPDGRTLALGSGSGREWQVALLRAATESESVAPTNAAPASATQSPSGLPVEPKALRATLPPRARHTPVELLDLTEFYNGSLTEGWIPSSEFGTTLERNLGALPRGIQELAGVRFDVRGLIQLAGRPLNSYLGASYPDRIAGLPVSLKCQRLHFLHGTGWRMPDGKRIGAYVIHYADGQKLEVPINYGEQVRDWVSSLAANANEPTAQAVVAWTGRNAVAELRLYKFTWENPRPEAAIERLDFQSENTVSSPFLIAITAEQSK